MSNQPYTTSESSRTSQVETDLQLSEERFRQLAENVQEVFWLRDRATGKIIYVSPQYEKIWGRSCASLYESPASFVESVHPEDKDEVFRRHRLLLDEGIPFEYEYRIIHPDGSERWIWARTHPVFDQQGQMIRFAGIAEDITHRKEIAQALEESENRYRSLFDTMLEGFALHEIICDPAGRPIDYRFLEVNQAFERLTNLSKEQLIGKTVLEVMPHTEVEWINRYGEVALEGKRIHFEDYSGELGKYYQVTAFSPQKNRFAVIFSDITTRKLAEKEREKLISELENKNAELERFTYTVSHDLKSPLITIKGFLGLVRQDLDAGNVAHAQTDLIRIENAAEMMKNLLDDLLELSRIGRMANMPVEINALDLVHETLDLVSGLVRDRQVKITVAPDLPNMYGDYARIQEVFQNLIENAVKYMGSQVNPLIEIGWRRDNQRTVYFVRDNGIGIDPRYHEKVFGLFEKLDPRSEGTGVGLALVKRIVEYHQGRVWVESDGKGKGSTFFFYLAATVEGHKKESP